MLIEYPDQTLYSMRERSFFFSWTKGKRAFYNFQQTATLALQSVESIFKLKGQCVAGDALTF